MQPIGASAKLILERIEKLRESLQHSETTQVSSDEKRYDCPICKDELGLLITDDHGVEYWRTCSCVSERRLKRLLKSSRITEAFQRLNFDNFTLENRPLCVKKSYRIANEYLDNFETIRHAKHNSILFVGQPGSGKTHLLIAVANALLSNGFGVLYFPWVEGSNELRDAIKSNADANAIVQRMKETDVLFIDDLYKGRKQPTDYQLEWLFEVVNYRYLNHLPMMVSSEKYMDLILEIDEGIGRRIFERSSGYMVSMILDQGEEKIPLNFSIYSRGEKLLS